MQANQGAVTVQAQNDELQLNALKDATLTSSAGKIAIAAKEEVLITCKGAYIKLANGEVEIGSPKVVRVRAPLVVSGASSMDMTHPSWPKTLPKRPMKINLIPSPHSSSTYIGMPYSVYVNETKIKEGIINGKDDLIIDHEISTEKYRVVLGNGEEYRIHMVNEFNDNTAKNSRTNQGFHPREFNDREISGKDYAQKYYKLVHKDDGKE